MTVTAGQTAGQAALTHLSAVLAAAALCVGYLLGWWKSKSEIDKLKWDLTQSKLQVETKSLGQMVMVFAESRKVAADTRDLVFSEADMREWVGDKHALRLHAALDMLRDEGKAKKASAPACWIID